MCARVHGIVCKCNIILVVFYDIELRQSIFWLLMVKKNNVQKLHSSNTSHSIQRLAYLVSDFTELEHVHQP